MNKLYMGWILLLLPACYSTKIEDSAMTQQTFFIQAISDTPIVNTIKKTVTSIADEIIKEELQLDKNYAFTFFLPKEMQRITLYYMYDVYENGKATLFTAFDQIKWREPHNVLVAPEVNFFGDQQDELVVMINDCSKELLHLNQEIKKIAHEANTEYKRAYNDDLFDKVHSEKFPFLPHMGLGRIRLHSIKQHIKDESQMSTIVDRIRQRIISITLKIVHELMADQNIKLSFNTISVFDFQKRAYIKEYHFIDF